MEAPVFGWLFVWLLLSLILPCAVAARFCCTKENMERLHNENSSNSSEESDSKWTRIALAILMHVLLLLLVSCVVVMLISNEQLSKTSTIAPNITKIILNDIETFVKNTQMQISVITSSSMRTAVDAAHRNLEGAEELLGKPLQSALDAETGLEAELQALVDLKRTTGELSSRVSDLLKDCNEARKVRESLQGSLIELSRLLTLARQECLPRDQVLCDTLQTYELNVSLQIDQLSEDKNLLYFREMEDNESFNKTIEITRRIFQGLPRRVSLETAVLRAGLRSSLNRHRNELYDAVQALEDLSRSITENLRSARNGILKGIRSVSAKDLWRWLAVLGLSLLIFFVWGLLMCGAPCGCGSTPKTIPFLLTALGLTCALSLILLAFGTVAFILGGHTQTLICQPLYDEPKYTVLSDLLNAGGILYQDEGLFNHLLKGNVSLHVDVVLRNCQNNRPAYRAFNLQNIFNFTLLANQNEWQDFKHLVQKFSVNLSTFEILTPALQSHLRELLTVSQENLTTYRTGISGLVTNKDLNSFAEQLEIVAKQLSDLENAQKLETLAEETKKIISTEVQALREIRDRILYKIAAVEILMIPLRIKINQSLTNLERTQDFIKNKGFKVTKRVAANYLGEMESYLMQMFTYVNRRITQDVGKCRPLWDSFQAARTMICKMTVDPMNGFSLACFLCILLFLGLAPVIIRTVAQYKETTEDTFSSITHRRARNGLLIDDEGTWATPSPPRSEEVPRLTEPSAWTTSRQPSESLIPSPPRPRLERPPDRVPEPQVVTRAPRILDPTRLIQLTSRIQEQPRTITSPVPRIFQQGASNAERDKSEALKLLKRIDRRTPRSWL